MSAIKAANSPDNQAIASFLRSNSTASAATPPTDSTKPDTASDTASGADEAATVVDLSDHAKTILAKAQTDQVAADSLQAFIDAHRAGKTDNTSSKSDADTSSKNSASKVVETYQRLTAATVVTVDPQALAPVNPKISFHNSLQIDGFSISVSADASTGAFKTSVYGPGGISADHVRFGRNGEVGGGSVPNGVGMMDAQTAGNKEYITFYSTDFSAESLTASSDAGTVSASSVSAHAWSKTFAIDFNTGAISTTENDLTLTATTAGYTPFSRVA
ncbi:MAG: hypothetical protein JWQ17_456 [Tardiphaga sp.]|jgi:hypothetical protein|nr:hypothetical protein [Tardiphaga sp.]